MKIIFISLGCDKNLVESEQMMSILSERGYEFTDDETLAEAAVINSCCFIGDAKEESIETVLDLSHLKDEGSLRFIILAGCLAQRYADEVRRELPEVDAIVGTTAFDKIADVLDSLRRGESVNALCDRDRLVFLPRRRTISTAGYFEYLKIAEGCDKCCTYCIIPSVRGRYRSIPLEDLIEDAERLVSLGVRELILIAQETTLYGVDLYGKKTLPELLRRLCRLEGLFWIRLMYCYPEEIDDELIEVIQEEPKICRYLDIPIQHSSDRILQAMGRRTSASQIEDTVRHLREALPDICLRTTIISGFPTETESEHRELLDFVGRLRFDRLGDFTYSPEEGTAAAKMDGQIDDEIKERRRDEVMERQQRVAFDISKEQIGKVFDVIVEGYLPDDGVYVGRTYRDAPDVDGLIFLENPKGEMRELISGEFVRAKVTKSSGYDLTGEILL